MKKFKSIFLFLTMVFVIAGCKDAVADKVVTKPSNSDSVVIENEESSLKIGELYNKLKESQGSEVATQYLVNAIIELELNIATDVEMQELYEKRVEAKLLEFTKDSSYFSFGLFDEEKLYNALTSQGYNVVCNYADEDGKFGPRYDLDRDLEVVQYLLCDYEDYVAKEIKNQVLVELLQEQYILDILMEENADLITRRRPRRIEYFTISREDFDKSNTFMKEAAASLMNGKTFEDLEESWNQKLLEEIKEDYDKIGTSDDFSGANLMKFGFMDGKFINVEDGKMYHDRQVYETSKTFSAIITTNNKGDLSENLASSILNADVIENRTVTIGQDNYLVDLRTHGDINEDDILILDPDKNVYYFIKVSLIDFEDEAEVREVVELMRDTQTSKEDVLEHYIGKYNISVHDEEIYEYLQMLYPAIF